MEESVNSQTVAESERSEENKAYNFRRLEQAREQEREARIRAETELSMMQQRLSSIENRFVAQEKDPLDDVEDYVDKDRLKAKLAREREIYKREAEEIARKTYADLQQQDRKNNYLQRLNDKYEDFEDVMNEQNIAHMTQTNPEFAQSLLRIDDQYERRELAYKHIKRSKNNASAKGAIKDKIDENQRNPYHIPYAVGSGVANSGVVSFDPNNRQSKQDAYDKLKSAQRKPIGGGLNR